MIRVYPEYRLEDEHGKCPVITLLGEGYARSCCVGVPPRRAKYLGCGSAGIVGRTAVQGSICPTYVDEPASWMPSPHSCPDISLMFPSHGRARGSTTVRASDSMIGDREIALVEPGYDEACEAAGAGTLIQRCNWPRHPTVSGMRQFGVSRLLGFSRWATATSISPQLLTSKSALPTNSWADPSSPSPKDVGRQYQPSSRARIANHRALSCSTCLQNQYLGRSGVL